MKINLSNRLSFKLARNTVLVALALGMVLNLFQVLLDYINEKSALDRDIQALITISHTPASQIAYNIDSRLAEELLGGLLKHPSIIEAEIIDSDNRVLARKHRKLTSTSYRWLSDLLFEPTRYYSTHLAVQQLSDINLGNLNVIVDTYPSGIAFLKRASFTLISGFIKSLALSALLLLVFYVMLTKPLLKVINAVSEVDPETPEKVRLPVPKGHQHDEIGILVESTNDHLQTVERSLQLVRKTESRLKHYSEQLEQIVETRTRELSDKNDQLIKINQELVVAKEEAIRRATARADFLANMSHEIRTPFNGVLGMISLTMEEPLSDRQKRQLDVAYNSGVSLLDLLNDILDISKVESGKLTLESISFNLRHTIEEVSSLLAQNAHAKHIDLVLDVDPRFPEAVYGDPTRLRQVVSNLTGNAIKFTEHGTVTIKLFIDSGYTVVQVIDTGIGIPSDSTEKIFAPFSQAYSDTTRKYGGTGLGLALCRQLVTHMQGSLTVESIEGKGSCFTTKIPLEVDLNSKQSTINTQLDNYEFLVIHRDDNSQFINLIKQLQHWNLHLKIRAYSDKSKLNDLSISINAPEKTIVLIDEPLICNLINDKVPRDHIILISGINFATNKDSQHRLFYGCHLHSPYSRSNLEKTLLKTIGLGTKTTQVSNNDNPKAGEGHSVLLVEDNQVNQMVAKAILTKLGYQVMIALNGKEAVDLVKAHSFDAILMDCHMPVMDGYEATQYIRTELRKERLPIIAVTANVMHGDREKCYSAGMNDYITKPYDRHDLLSVLKKWIDRPEDSDEPVE
ncbi:hybrid sensor histidine kinase/response regulator [Alkalimarinus alittae]|uniref:histidine kinase n=1 Tax=Alkalimarinus alittae TaxID=2961619 RepID=A0ABY6N708_9ALTE|nr:ATP-binding protein [Alkalimarinus alittae]UZE97925.1 ATP-binding protein [Alkalimarinus alittae]